ncbi:MAG TPA: hypothetical protein VJJ98_11410, partial [Sedimentisphaerales bacterium]|nr:hypothetical protein [Sedimentisphaerales bacterium]
PAPFMSFPRPLCHSRALYVIPAPFMSFPRPLCHSRALYVIPAQAGIQGLCQEFIEQVGYVLKSLSFWHWQLKMTLSCCLVRFNFQFGKATENRLLRPALFGEQGSGKFV